MSETANRWDALLQPGEKLCWEGRPAPRCYTFRHWKHSVFGGVFLAVSLYWQILGVEMAKTYAVPWLAFLPLPFLLIGVYFSIGHLVQARLEWEHVYYLITDRRLITRRGLKKASVQEMARNEITYFKIHKQGEELATLKVHRGTEGMILLHCIEHPQAAVSLLRESIRQNMGDSSPPQE